MLDIRIDKKIITLGAGIAIVIIVFVLMIVPLLGQISKKSREVKALEQEMTSARHALLLENKFQGVGNLLTRQQISLAIDGITKKGAAQNIKFLSISPQAITKNKNAEYPELPIRMDVQSTYKDLGLFLGELEKLKESIVAVKSIKIEADRMLLPQLRTELTVEIYLKEGEDG